MRHGSPRAATTGQSASPGPGASATAASSGDNLRKPNRALQFVPERMLQSQSGVPDNTRYQRLYTMPI